MQNNNLKCEKFILWFLLALRESLPAGRQGCPDVTSGQVRARAIN
jgi:hypothetical protein